MKKPDITKEEIKYAMAFGAEAAGEEWWDAVQSVCEDVLARLHEIMPAWGKDEIPEEEHYPSDFYPKARVEQACSQPESKVVRFDSICRPDYENPANDNPLNFSNE